MVVLVFSSSESESDRRSNLFLYTILLGLLSTLEVCVFVYADSGRRR